MPVYLIYDRQTGQIIHRHRQSDPIHPQVAPTRERLLRLAGSALPSERLDILTVEDAAIQPGKGYRVNLESKTLETEP
ncbi:MAG TPA: hypothetical protein VFB38_14900 [Chthonomonadaceae bacterium]|nr:hypothetical protein [Chthonomonadaceae bacterium]